MSVAADECCPSAPGVGLALGLGLGATVAVAGAVDTGVDTSTDTVGGVSAIGVGTMLEAVDDGDGVTLAVVGSGSASGCWFAISMLPEWLTVTWGLEPPPITVVVPDEPDVVVVVVTPVDVDSPPPPAEEVDGVETSLPADVFVVSDACDGDVSPPAAPPAPSALEFVSSAHAMPGVVAIAKPTPNATARAPTRPTNSE